MSDDVLKRMRDERLSAWESAKEIADRAANENRAMTGEEETAWNKANSDINTIDARAKAILDAEKRRDEADAMFADLEKRKAAAGVETATDDDPSAKLRKFLQGESGRSMELRGKFPAPELRTGLVKGTNSAGGYTVPTSFYDRLIQHLIFNAAILQTNATVLNTETGEVIQVPKTTAHPTAALVAEGVAIGEVDPTFGQVNLAAYKFANLIQISRELIQDTGVDLDGYMSQRSGVALGNAFGAYAVTGTGSSQPTGVLTQASSGLQSANTGATGAFTADDVISMFYSLIPPYRTNAQWFLSTTALSLIRKFKTTTNGYIWQPSYQIGQPDTLQGKPVIEDPNMPTIALSSKSVLFGDFTNFFVRMAGPIRYERSDDYAFNTDTVTFRAIMRADSNLVDTTGAVKYLQGAAS